MKILFICKNNQFRSQMACAIYNKLTKTKDAFSAGTFVGVPLNPENANIQQFFRFPDFFELMEEKGIYIRDNKTKKLSSKILKEADLAISMAEEPFVPDFLRVAKNVIFWNVENPSLVTRDVAQKIFDQINELVKGLIESKNLL